MKYIALSIALLAAPVMAIAADPNPYKWVLNDAGIPVIQEQRGGPQYLAIASCGFGDGDLRTITIYDGQMDFEPGLVSNRLRFRVDKNDIFESRQVDWYDFKGMGGQATIKLADELLADMIKGSVLRIDFGNNVVERYNLKNFTRSINNSSAPPYCSKQDNEYFPETDSDYFDV